MRPAAEVNAPIVAWWSVSTAVPCRLPRISAVVPSGRTTSHVVPATIVLRTLSNPPARSQTVSRSARALANVTAGVAGPSSAATVPRATTRSSAGSRFGREADDAVAPQRLLRRR